MVHIQAILFRIGTFSTWEITTGEQGFFDEVERPSNATAIYDHASLSTRQYFEP